MNLQSTIVKELVKVINSQPEKKTTLYYGTIDKVVGSGENKRAYVHIDGSAEDTSTPVVEGTEVLEGDRVIVTIENHQAIVMSNVTSPASARTATNYMDLSELDEGLIIGELNNDGHTFNVLIKSDGVYIRDGVGDEAKILAKYGGEGTVLYDDEGEEAAKFTANGILFYQELDGYVQYDTGTGLITNAKLSYADVEDLNAHYAHITNGVIDNATIDYADVENLNAHYAAIENGKIINATIDDANVNDLTAHYAHITQGVIDNAKIDYADVENLDANYAHITNGVIDNAEINYADVKDLNANFAHITSGVIDNAKIGYADVNNLNAHYAEIDLANVNNAWVTNGVIKDAAITDAQILGVSANKLTAGTIDASEINVANLRAKNLIIEKMNGQPILGGYELVNKNSTGYSSKNPSTEGWYEYQNGSFIASTDTTVNSSKAYYRDGNSVALYDQTYIDGLATNLNQRIDGAVETFTGSVVPTLVTYPAVDWTSAQMASHVGDIYYVINNTITEDGYCYRFAFDNSTQTYKWILIKDSDVTAALANISDLQDFQSETVSWIDETDDGLEIIRQNHTSLSGVVNKTVKESIQLWFTKANETAPNAPNSTTYPNGVSDTSTTGNGWRTVVPTYNSSYPYYFYCWQYKFVDNTYGWSAVIYDRATSESQNTARTTSATLASYVTSNDNAIAALQDQLDEQLDIWYGTATPTTTNTPASSWSTTTEKDNHIGDMYYDTTNGKVYQWTKSGSTYSWTEIPDGSAAAALAAAQEAQSTADGKRRVFTSQPTVPYDVGDLWVNGDEVKYATTKRTSGSYTASEWAQTATDDTVANANIKSSVQLWKTTNSETPPSKPYTDGSTSYINSTSTNGNAWTTVVPTYNASYPKYHYCYQQQRGDGKYQWTTPVFDGATSEAMAKAQSALPASTFTTFQSTTFQNLVDEVDEHSNTFTTMSTRIDSKADSSTVTTLSNTVSSVSQTATTNSTKLSNLTQTLGTNADGTTASNDIVHKYTTLESNLDGVTQRVGKTEAQIKGMYAVCDTAIGTADKVAVITPNVDAWEIYTGANITVKFINGNSAAVPMLSIKPSSSGTGSTKKNIKAYTGTSNLTENEYTWKAGTALSFFYDGSYWRLQDSSLVSRVSLAESEIVQQAGQISLKVSETDITGDYIASKINLSGSDASISAEKINFQGVADFDSYSLKTNTVSDLVIEYAKSSDPTTFTPVSGAAGSWSTSVPTWTNDNTYIWQKVTKSKADGSTPTTIMTCIQGIKGDTGSSSYTYVRYSANSNGSNMVTTPTSDTKYIGVYTGTSSTVPAYTAFTWSKYVGEDGDPGDPGDPGTSYYTFVRYSANSNGSSMTTTPQTDSKYIGIYTGTSSSAPTAYTSYTWSQYRGNDGDTYYTYVRYSVNSNGNPMVAAPTSDTKYIGIYTGTSSTVPVYTSFTWSKYVGEDGDPGDPGDSSYTFVRYSANSNGSSMTTTPQTNSKYIGIYIGDSNTAPTAYTSYTWSQYRGNDGDTYYTYVRYSANSNGNPMVETPTDSSIYIGIYTGTESTAPTSYSSYKWSRYRGQDGTSSQWYYGNKLVHTSGTASTATGITAAVVGDMYLNNETYSIYRCTTAGASGTAVWTYTGNLLSGLEDNIGATHRNLLRSGDLVRNKWINGSSGEQNSTKCFSSGYIPVSASTKYTLQLWQPSNSQTGNNRAWTGKFLWYNSSKTYISGYSSTYFADEHVTYTATSPSTAAYIRVTYQLPTGADVTPYTWTPYNTDYRWKLEVGDIASDWSLAPEDAIGERQAIYIRTTTNTIPNPPTARVTLNTESNNTWTRYRNPMIDISSPTYCYSFTCNQLLSIDGLFLGCESVVFENGHATIDGGNIIGGTLTVGAFDAASQSQVLNEKYITQIDSDGIFVHQVDSGQAGTTPTQSSSYGIHISDDIDIIKGGNIVASYGDVIILGKRVGSETNYARALFDYHSMRLYAKGDTYPYFYVNDARNQNGNANVIEKFIVDTASPDYDDSHNSVFETVHNITSIVAVYIDNNDVTQTSIYTKTGNKTVSFDYNVFDYPNSYIIRIEYSTTEPVMSFTFGSRYGSELIGPYSFSEGNNNISSGRASHAEGERTEASGANAHAEGWFTESSANSSHAEGYRTHAIRSMSHAEGLYTFAAGIASHVEGTGAIGATSGAYGNYSHAEGSGTFTGGESSHAEGEYSTAIGKGSHAEGDHTEAIGDYSHASGSYTNASAEYQTVVGTYNIIDTRTRLNNSLGSLFIVGNGSSNSRSMAFSVNWNGDAISYPSSIKLGIYIATGLLTSSGGNLQFSIPIGRLLPSNASISAISFKMVARAGTQSGTGVYIVKASDGGTDLQQFYSNQLAYFYNASNQSKGLTTSMWAKKTIEGGTNILISWDGGSNFFSGNETSNINNHPVVVYLSDIVVSFSYSATLPTS